MSAETLIKEVKALPVTEKERFLSYLFSDQEVSEEIERLGLLKLSEKAFDFWNDPREDVYQDYTRSVSQRGR